MRIPTCFLALALVVSETSAAEPATNTTPAATPSVASTWPEIAPNWILEEPSRSANRLAGTHQFPGFIGYISNPLQNIDPRAVTNFYPIFEQGWTAQAGPIPTADFQLYGAGLTVALSDRFAVGLNQGGYAEVNLSRADRALVTAVQTLGPQRVRNLLVSNPQALVQLLRNTGVDVRDLVRLTEILRADPTLKYFNDESGGDRGGWLNLGGFVQYTLIQDVPNQFMVTVGLRIEAPAGSHEIYQGHGPAHLAPYLTAGKEFGNFHVLSTVGYYFPAGPGDDTTEMFYADLHIDRRTFGWLYPLVELNYIQHTTGIALDLPARRGLFDLDNFSVSGNIVTMAVGANAVLVPEKFEVGAAYLTDIAAQRNFSINGLILKMVYRY